MDDTIDLQGLDPLNEADLTAVLSNDSNVFLAVPPEIFEWIQGYDEAALLAQLVKLVFADRPVLSMNAAMVGEAVNPTRMIDLLVALLEDAQPEQQDGLSFYMVGIVLSCKPRHLPLDHPTMQTLLRSLARSSTANRHKIIDLIGELGTKDAFDHVLPYLGDSDWNVHYKVVSALLCLDIARALPIVWPLLAGNDETLRWCICNTLSEQRSPLAVDLLVDRLRHDDSADVRTMAAFALGVTGDPRATPALAHAAATDPAVDGQGYRVDDSAAQSVVRIIMFRLGEYVQSGDTSGLRSLLNEAYAQSGQLAHLMQQWQAEQQQYGRLRGVTPVSYFRGGDRYTYFDALDPEFGIRASFKYEQCEIEYNMLFERSKNDWHIQHIARHVGC